MLAAHAAFMTGAGLPPPTVSGFSPTSAYTGSWFTLTINGNYFVPGSTSVSISGSSAGTPTVNTAGTSMTLSVYGTAPGGQGIYVTTPFGSVYAGAFTFVTPPPPMGVTKAYRSNDFNNTFDPSTSAVMVNGYGFTGNTQAYQGGAWRPTAVFSSGALYFLSSAAAPGSFFLYDSVTGSATGWISYS